MLSSILDFKIIYVELGTLDPYLIALLLIWEKWNHVAGCGRSQIIFQASRVACKDAVIKTSFPPQTRVEVMRMLLILIMQIFYILLSHTGSR